MSSSTRNPQGFITVAMRLEMEARVGDAARAEGFPFDEMLSILAAEGLRARYGVTVKPDGTVPELARPAPIHR